MSVQIRPFPAYPTAPGYRDEASGCVCRVRRLAGRVGIRTQGVLSRFRKDSSCCDGQRRETGAKVSSLTLRAGKTTNPSCGTRQHKVIAGWQLTREGGATVFYCYIWDPYCHYGWFVRPDIAAPRNKRFELLASPGSMMPGFPARREGRMRFHTAASGD